MKLYRCSLSRNCWRMWTSASRFPSLPASVKTSLTFPVTTSSIANAQKGFERAFAEERQLQSLLLDEQGKRMDAAATASVIGAKLSGLAMWPTLVCDGSEGTLIVSRGKRRGPEVALADGPAAYE